MKTCIRIALGLLIFVLTPVANAEDVADEPGGRVCLNIRTINFFNTVGNEFLYVRAAGRKHYLFTMQRSCPGLRSANEIALSDSMGRACSNTMPKVIYDDWGMGPASCRVLNIEQVASHDDAKQLAEAHKKQRENRRSDDR